MSDFRKIAVHAIAERILAVFGDKTWDQATEEDRVLHESVAENALFDVRDALAEIGVTSLPLADTPAPALAAATEEPRARLATEMSYAEWQAARKELLAAPTPDLAALRAERDVAQANVERLLTGLRLLAGGTFDADPPFVAVPAETLRKLAADLVAGKSVQDIAPALFRALAARAALAEARADG